ncbi:protein WVD2-like 7 [Rhodamnia argentea]|uniref:Protein WVD2-like 7 n=1 Tax=Rhodamnia argentea TaxID=178133 RepID=A0A8B8P3F5_9MYRT|nr:protein WVD2-like 7 [Rhodamnia argentea]XP_030529306.1 protein WVD2-like 7 [Rhodamnia argentea]XP_048135134.1 protein WVD2-like 7 [Rhodamnia argentea]
MAGEFEETFSVSFQADSIHSGSISFGRFEKEPLAWERRSSFLHNRYLEEVEKFSKPGSVNEKKALLEAHFKKKPLLHQSSSEWQTGRDHRRDEYDTSDDTSREGFELAIEDNYFGHYDESPARSGCSGEYEVRVGKREDPGVSSFPSHEKEVFDDLSMDFIPIGYNARMPIYLEEGHDDLPIGCAETQTQIDATPSSDYDQREAENCSEAIHSDMKCETNQMVEKNCSETSHLSPKLASASDTKLTEATAKSQFSAADDKRNISAESSNDLNNTLGGRIRGSPLKTNRQKDLTMSAVQASRLVHKTSNSEQREKPVVKPVREDNSKREGGKKISEPQSMSLMKLESRVDSTRSRLKQIRQSQKPETKATSKGFYFLSDQRAQRRKEFYMRLEEKMHAKEAEINEIQAKAQEETEAEIKQFRKRLNFKAMPMPTFYRTTLPSGPDGNKASSSKVRSSISSVRYPSPQKQAASRPRIHSKAGNCQLAAASVSLNTTNPPEASLDQKSIGKTRGFNVVSSIPSSSKAESAGVATANEAASRKGREDDNGNTNKQKSKASATAKTVKGQRVEGKQKAGVKRDDHQTMRKDTRSVCMSRTGRVAVSVTS